MTPLNKSFVLLCGSLSFFLTLYIFQFYTHGDVINYSNGYNAVFGVDLVQGFFSYRNSIGSSEPIHFFLSWLISNLDLPRVYFVAIQNAGLTMAFISLGIKKNASLIVLLILSFGNFYFWALYTEIERLKLAFIFAILFFYFIDESKSKASIFFLLAVFTHVQFVILFSGFFSCYVFTQLKKIIYYGRINARLFYFIIFSFLFLFLMKSHIVSKFNAYFEGLDFYSLIKLLPFLLLSCFYSKKPTSVFIFFIPLLLSVVFLGGSRLNIFGYFIFIYFGLQYRKGINFGVFITTIYYLFQSIGFINNIFISGRGF